MDRSTLQFLQSEDSGLGMPPREPKPQALQVLLNKEDGSASGRVTQFTKKKCKYIYIYGKGV